MFTLCLKKVRNLKENDKNIFFKKGKKKYHLEMEKEILLSYRKV